MADEAERTLLYRELATIHKVINLSPQSALDRAETFLTQQGYTTSLRTGSSLTVKRSDPNHPTEERVLALKVVPVPQSEGGGVQIKVSGNDEEGMRERQNQWREWVESLPEKVFGEPDTETAPPYKTEDQVPVDDPEKSEPNVMGEEESLGMEENPEEADSQDQAFEVTEVSTSPTGVPHSYEYKMVQLPPLLSTVDEGQEGDKAARHLQSVANEHGKEGWEFYRVDTLGDRAGQRQYFIATFRRLR